MRQRVGPVTRAARAARLTPPESFKFVYEPFQVSIPLESL